MGNAVSNSLANLNVLFISSIGRIHGWEGRNLKIKQLQNEMFTG